MKESSASEAIFVRACAALDVESRRCFGEVDEAAQPFVSALVARAAAGGRVWIVCSDVRAQEDFAAELIAWLPPDLETPIGDDALPDPETSAESLEILGLLAQVKSTGPLVIHAAQWAKEVPSARALAKSVLSLAKGDRVVLLETGEKLISAGYERVARLLVAGVLANAH